MISPPQDSIRSQLGSVVSHSNSVVPEFRHDAGLHVVEIVNEMPIDPWIGWLLTKVALTGS